MTRLGSLVQNDLRESVKYLRRSEGFAFCAGDYLARNKRDLFEDRGR